MHKSISSVYDQDTYRWAMENAALLRAGAVDQADLANIAEELEDLGKSQKKELASRVRVILTHLLKLEFSSASSDRSLQSWRSTLETQRADLEYHLNDNPSLLPTVRDVILTAYPRACRAAAQEAKLPIQTFPATCPYTPKQVLGDYFPKR